MKTLKIWLLFVLIFSTTSFIPTKHTVTAQAQEPVLPVIPPQLSHATDFVQFLLSVGLTVQEVLQSHHTGLLGTNRQAAFIRTNKGVVEVVVFPNETDAEKITIIYSRSSSTTVPHLYIINGRALNGKRQTWQSAYPIYVTLHKNWFIVTLDCELEEIIKRGLKQTNRPARQ